jgi:hypothetical protein
MMIYLQGFVSIVTIKMECKEIQPDWKQHSKTIPDNSREISKQNMLYLWR